MEENTEERIYLEQDCQDPEKYFKVISEISDKTSTEDVRGIVELINDVATKWPSDTHRFLEILPQEIRLQIMCEFILKEDYASAAKVFKVLDFKVADYYPVHIILKTGNADLIEEMDKVTNYLSSLYIDLSQIKSFDDLEVVRGYTPEMGVDGLTEIVYGKNTAFFKKSLIKQIFPKGPERPNLKGVNFLMKFKKEVPLYPSDNLANFSAEDIQILDMGDVNFSHFQCIIKFFGEERAMKLMKKPVDEGILRDTEHMFRRLAEKISFIEDDNFRNQFTGKNLRKEFPKKPKCVIKDIHDRLTSILEKVGQAPRALGRKDVAHLDGIKIPDEKLKIWVPESSVDLIEVGQALNFCIGNGVYADKTIEGKKDQCPVKNRGLKSR